jgi:hypothetical protein
MVVLQIKDVQGETLKAAQIEKLFRYLKECNSYIFKKSKPALGPAQPPIIE